MVKSKDKGNKFENEMFRELKQTLQECRKTLGSGSAKDESGDILSLRYCIECKHHKVIEENQINSWWKKITKEARDLNKIPVLIYKANRRPIMVQTWVRGIKYIKRITTARMYLQQWKILICDEVKYFKEVENDETNK